MNIKPAKLSADRVFTESELHTVGAATVGTLTVKVANFTAPVQSVMKQHDAKFVEHLKSRSPMKTNAYTP